MNKKILYVEISTAHTEIINSFVQALLPEYQVHLLINEKSYHRVQHLVERITISTLQEKTFLKDVLRCKRSFQPDTILLNSAQGRRIRELCVRLLFDSTPIVGIHHNAENIYRSFTQKLIHLKIKKYIVLADFIRDFLIAKMGSKRIQVQSFYPLTYPQVKKINIDPNLKYILIPGVIEQDRRDYFGFINMVKIADSSLIPEIRFVLIGNSKNHNGPEVLKLINEFGLQHRFVTFNQYVEDETLMAYVEPALAVMPLMHPGTRWFEKYFETKISGAYSLAFAFHKKLLMHQVFENKPEFKDYGLFYNTENFADKINELIKNPIPKIDPKFDFKIQKQKLLTFLTSD